MKNGNKSMMIYIIIGVIIGYLSQLGRNLYAEQGNYLAVSLALIFLVITAEINKKAFGIKKEFKWFLSNGGWMYLLVWFVSWIIFFNPPFNYL